MCSRSYYKEINYERLKQFLGDIYINFLCPHFPVFSQKKKKKNSAEQQKNRKIGVQKNYGLGVIWRWRMYKFQNDCKRKQT